MSKYRRKPLVFEAVQYTGENYKEIEDFCGSRNVRPSNVMDCPDIYIFTLEGEHQAKVNDWILKGVNGEFWPVKPDIFHKSYELAEVAVG